MKMLNDAAMQALRSYRRVQNRVLSAMRFGFGGHLEKSVT